MSSCVLDTDTELLLSPVNYAETLVKPAEDEATLRSAISAPAALGIRLVAASVSIAREASRHRGLNISLADGFAIATAQARAASVASFEPRVRGALRAVGVDLAAGL